MIRQVKEIKGLMLAVCMDEGGQKLWVYSFVQTHAGESFNCSLAFKNLYMEF